MNHPRFHPLALYFDQLPSVINSNYEATMNLFSTLEFSSIQVLSISPFIATYLQLQLFLKHLLSYLSVVPFTYSSFFFYLNKILYEIEHVKFWGRSGKPRSTSPIPYQPVRKVLERPFGKPLVYREKTVKQDSFPSWFFPLFLTLTLTVSPISLPS